MSKKSRTRKVARDELAGGPSVMKVKDPGDVIAMIPYLLGFEPAESIVVIALQGPRRRFGPCMRLDLVDDVDDAADLVNYLCGIIQQHGFTRVMAVAFTQRPLVAEAVMSGLETRLQANRVQVTEALRADGSRWWSYQCRDPSCCGPAGTLYDVETSRVAAEAVLSGMSKVESREALREQFEPAEPGARAAVAESCRGLGRLPGPERPSCWPTEKVRQAITAGLRGPHELSSADLAGLLVAVQDTSRRDVAWTMIDRSAAAAHFALWRRVMTVAPDELMAPAGSLTGFAAWLTGRGVLAAHAADRVAAVAPTYRMGVLLRQVLESSLSPDAWDDWSARPDATA